MSVGSTSAIHHTPNNSVTLSFVKPVNHQLNIVPLSRVGVSRAYSLASSSSSLARRSKVVLQNKFYGTRLQTSGSERLNVRQLNPRVVVRSALSQVPEKPLGIYDPSFDKDSCGVGFVAELSGESSRKTVTDAVEMLVRMSHRGACGRVEMCGTCFSLPNADVIMALAGLNGGSWSTTFVPKSTAPVPGESYIPSGEKETGMASNFASLWEYQWSSMTGTSSHGFGSGDQISVPPGSHQGSMIAKDGKAPVQAETRTEEKRERLD